MITITRKLALLMGLFMTLASCQNKEDVQPADALADFLGSFEVQTEDPADRYTITFTKDETQPNSVKIANFGGFIKKNTVYGQVAGTKLTIAMQSFPIAGGTTLVLNGEGTLNGNTLSLHYEAGGDYEGKRDVVAIRK